MKSAQVRRGDTVHIVEPTILRVAAAMVEQEIQVECKLSHYQTVPHTIPDPRNNGAELPLVMVEWVDAIGDSDWQHFDVALKTRPAPCFAAGFLIDRTEEYVMIAPTGRLDLQWVNTTLTIPAPWILKITPLGVVNGSNS